MAQLFNKFFFIVWTQVWQSTKGSKGTALSTEMTLQEAYLYFCEGKFWGTELLSNWFDVTYLVL